MASNISGIRSLVIPRIQDAKPVLSISPDMTCALDVAILAALAEYQVARPRVRAKLVTGTGAFDYPLTGGGAILTGFVDGFSQITEVVYPWDGTTPSPPVLQSNEFAIVRLDGDAPFLRFFTIRPTATQQFLVTYTTPHTLNASTSSVPAADDDTLADLASCYACEAIAGYYNQTEDASIQADSSNRITNSDSYRASARRWRDLYKSKMTADAAQGPAAVVAQVDEVFSNEVDRYHFHGRRFR